jgi:hypothetical protein
MPGRPRVARSCRLPGDREVGGAVCELDLRPQRGVSGRWLVRFRVLRLPEHRPGSAQVILSELAPERGGRLASLFGYIPESLSAGPFHHLRGQPKRLAIAHVTCPYLTTDVPRSPNRRLHHPEDHSCDARADENSEDWTYYLHREPSLAACRRSPAGCRRTHKVLYRANLGVALLPTIEVSGCRTAPLPRAK